MESARLAVAADLGGTKTAVGVVDRAGTVLAKRKAPAEKWRAEATAAQVAELAGEALGAASVSWEAVAGVGACVPGIYFEDTGAAWAPNLWGRGEVPFRELLEQRLPAPVVIDSDRSACVLGEQWLGAARGLRGSVPEELPAGGRRLHAVVLARRDERRPHRSGAGSQEEGPHGDNGVIARQPPAGPA